jgi:hypothetical protein
MHGSPAFISAGKPDSVECAAQPGKLTVDYVVDRSARGRFAPEFR